MIPLDRSYGVVLEGGGAKGAYQVGAWKALRETGVTIRGVVGSSVGSLNGVMMVMDDFEGAWDIWSHMDLSHITTMEDEELTKAQERESRKKKKRWRRLRHFFGIRGMDITPLKELIRARLDENAVRRSDKDFGLVTVSLSDRKAMRVFKEDIPQGQLADYLLASCYLPVFKTERLHGKLYLDGGLIDNLPAGMLLDRGYTDLIIIRILGIGMGFLKKNKLHDINAIIIEPRENLGGILDFSARRARYNLRLGYYDALRVLRGLSGRRYYIDNPYDDIYVLKRFFSMVEHGADRIAELFNLQRPHVERAFFEDILPRLARLLDLSGEWTYADLWVAACEHVAKTAGIERFAIYTMNDFFDKVKDWVRENDIAYRSGSRETHRLLGLVSELLSGM